MPEITFIFISHSLAHKGDMVFISFFLLHLSSWLLARFIWLISTSFLCYIVLSVLKARQWFYDSLLLNLGIHQNSQCSGNEMNCILEH